VKVTIDYRAKSRISRVGGIGIGCDSLLVEGRNLASVTERLISDPGNSQVETKSAPMTWIITRQKIKHNRYFLSADYGLPAKC